ncbi:DUF4258 domain-containing protein [Candidatus Woesearchaeota archaeon]|nr:DUF4258 domain-containing protein [Candidatus Woesearchaeota archaeon]
MKLVYSKHAKKRLKQRGIAEFEVEHILQHPISIKNLPEGLEEAVGESNNRIIKIVFDRKENYIKIVTVV